MDLEKSLDQTCRLVNIYIQGEETMHNIKDKYVDPNNNCLYCSIGNVLSWIGFNMDEISHIFSGQLTFYYKSAEKQFNIGQEYPIRFLLDKQSLKRRLSVLFEPYGILANWREESSPSKSWEEIKKSLKDEPVVLFFDHYTLPYHESYCKEHGAHFVTALDYVDDNAIILDSMQLFNYFDRLPISMSCFERVLKNNISDISNAWLTIHVIEKKESLINKESIAQNLKNVILDMNRPSEGNEFWGIAGLYKFYEDVGLIINDEQLFQQLMNENEVFSNSIEGMFISMLRVAQQRKTFSTYIDSIALYMPFLDQELLLKAKESYLELYDMWIRIRNQFYIVYYKKSSKRLRNFSEEFLKIINAEKEALMILEEILHRIEQNI